MTGKANVTARLTAELERATRVAAAKLGLSLGEMFEDALKRHPKIKAELEAANGKTK